MSKNLKYLTSIFTIIFILGITISSYATSPNMNLISNATTNSTTNSLSSSNTVTSTSTTSSTSVTNLNPVTESGLGITNILNILLIAVGVVLILLGIAIIIKIKK